MQELMKDGRKGVKEIDGTLNRAEKLVEDTLQIGQQVSPWRRQPLSSHARMHDPSTVSFSTCQEDNPWDKPISPCNKVCAGLVLLLSLKQAACHFSAAVLGLRTPAGQHRNGAASKEQR